MFGPALITFGIVVIWSSRIVVGTLIILLGLFVLTLQFLSRRAGRSV